MPRSVTVKLQPSHLCESGWRALPPLLRTRPPASASAGPGPGPGIGGSGPAGCGAGAGAGGGGGGSGGAGSSEATATALPRALPALPTPFPGFDFLRPYHKSANPKTNQLQSAAAILRSLGLSGVATSPQTLRARFWGATAPRPSAQNRRGSGSGGGLSVSSICNPSNPQSVQYVIRQ